MWGKGKPQVEAIKTLSIGGRTLEFWGNPQDPYFADLEAHHEAAAGFGRYLTRHLRPDAVVLDIGANIGLMTLPMALACPQGHVWAFEPVAGNAAFLRRNLEANGIANCTVTEAALGARTGVLRMRLDGAFSHPVTESSLDRAGEQGEVNAIALDEFAAAAEPAIARVDFIKLDVEGFEPVVLSGARRLIARERPPILAEFNAWCLAFCQGFHPFSFAYALWRAFEVSRLSPEGDPLPAGSDAGRFLHDHLVHHGACEDVLLRLRDGAEVPTLAEIKRGPGFLALESQLAAEKQRAEALAAEIAVVRAELAAVRGELDALQGSRSWRLTAPLRALRRGAS